jgi:hypothetical protein
LERKLAASKAEVERLKGIVKAQQDELEAISFALGTNEGHSSVDHIVTLKAEVERLSSAMRSFIDFMDENLGTTADWPMEVIFDDEETCQRHCDHLNAMKRIVKPEDIND